MIQPNELITFLLAIGTLIFLLTNWKDLCRQPAFLWLFAAFCTLTCGWLLSINEGFFWKDLCNTLEHISYGITALLLLIFCIFSNTDEENRP